MIIIYHFMVRCWLTDKSCTPSPPTPLPGGEGSRTTPPGSLSHRERARMRAFGVLAEKFCQSIRVRCVGSKTKDGKVGYVIVNDGHWRVGL
ncbi:MAG: hypothetical protein LVT47_11300 [Cyanobacteria bacterium LVE1205-1]